MTEWWAQSFAPEGSTTAGGILRQLGRPGLDELTVLVRETAQNSWDARDRSTEDPIQFAVRLEQLGQRVGAWRSVLLPGPAPASVADFESVLTEDSWIGVISDRGTVGLRGPIRASSKPKKGEGNDFVQFLRNVGEPRDTELGGGTYGFGKGILYRLSSVAAILADSAVRTERGIERRLMGAALGKDYYDQEDVRYTGRHWWGAVGSDDMVDPIVGSEAERLSRELGLPEFETDATGTNLVIIGFDLGAEVEDGEAERREPLAAAEHLASSILWHLWPKFSSSDPGRRLMEFRVELQGASIEIPDPSTVAELVPFVQALSAVRTGRAEQHRRTRPELHVGDIAVEIAPSTPSGLTVVDAARPFEGAPRHVARMRMTELVVDYLEGPPHPDPLFAYGGVYRSTEPADQYFADSEPPTHDSWVESGLAGVTKSIVNSARMKIRSSLSARFAPSVPATAASASGIGGLSRRLAGLVARVRSTAPEPAESRSGSSSAGGSGAVPKRIRVVGDPWIGTLEDRVAVFARVMIPEYERPTEVVAAIDIVLDGGGRESQSPAGASTPAIIGWTRADTAQVEVYGEALADPQAGEWLVLGELHDDVVTRFRFEEVVTGGT